MSLGLFLFTGLSRKYVATIRNNHFIYEEGVFKLIVWKKEKDKETEIKLPLKSELQILIYEYCTSLDDSNRLDRVLKKMRIILVAILAI